MATRSQITDYRRLREERSRHDEAHENLHDMAGPERSGGDRPMSFNCDGVLALCGHAVGGFCVRLQGQSGHRAKNNRECQAFRHQSASVAQWQYREAHWLLIASRQDDF